MAFFTFLLGLTCAGLAAAHAPHEVDAALKARPSLAAQARADPANREAIGNQYKTMFAPAFATQTGPPPTTEDLLRSSKFGPTKDDLLYEEGCAPLDTWANDHGDDRPLNSQEGLEDYAVADKFTDEDLDAYAETFKDNLTPDHLKQFKWELCDLRRRAEMYPEDKFTSEHRRKVFRIIDVFKKLADEDLAEHPAAGTRIKQMLGFDSGKAAGANTDAGKDIQLSDAGASQSGLSGTFQHGLRNVIGVCALIAVAGVVRHAQQQEGQQSDSNTLVQPLESDAEGPTCDFQPMEPTVV